MTTFDEELKKLEILSHHECCDDAKQYIYPPHQKGIVKMGNIGYGVIDQKNWYMDIQTDSESIDIEITHCPWCGMKLEVPK